MGTAGAVDQYAIGYWLQQKTTRYNKLIVSAKHSTKGPIIDSQVFNQLGIVRRYCNQQRDLGRRCGRRLWLSWDWRTAGLITIKKVDSLALATPRIGRDYHLRCERHPYLASAILKCRSMTIVYCAPSGGQLCYWDTGYSTVILIGVALSAL